MSSYLLTGGSRSGKSSYALELAESAEKPFYIATGWVPEGDEEMLDRIEKHQAERGEHWHTIEEQTNLIKAISNAVENNADCIIVDCLTFWTSNLMFSEELEYNNEVDKLIDFIPTIKTKLIFVTNEVGSGIVPENKLGREFRDLAGFLNQKIAKVADNVIAVISGIPLKLK